jgi:toxin ParE1/3/4
MSSPERRPILSPAAQADFTDILQYTLQTWGEAQMWAYRDLLDRALRRLIDNPLAGCIRPEISAVHRFHPAGSHLIVYRVTEHAVEVSRILHGRMDLKHHL